MTSSSNPPLLRHRRLAVAAIGLIILGAVGCTERQDSPDLITFVLASTTSTQDSGLLDALTARFEKDMPGYRAKVVAVGSGEAMELGRSGDADVLLVHSPEDELAFMREGRGVFRRPVMRNDFVIAGPPGDPVSISGSRDAAEAFARIARSSQRFVSRGDQSGTHRRELATWESASIRPAGRWYLETGQGMAETLTVASEMRAYVLTDTATLTTTRTNTRLVAAYTDDPTLINPYSVIPVGGARRLDAAIGFADWITGEQGREFISSFGVDRYGASLFRVDG